MREIRESRGWERGRGRGGGGEGEVGEGEVGEREIERAWKERPRE